jgi:uncharacterized membrane protein
MNKTRLEAFSDGVLAIIITIMVLEIKAPDDDNFDSLQHLIPVFLSYVLSFIYVGIYWNNHHHMFQVVKRVNGSILWGNLFLLFWLSLIPFATSWIGEHHFSAVPMSIYGFVLLMCSIAYNLLQNKIIKIDLKGKISTLAYLSAIPLAFVSPWISGLLYIAVAMLWIIPDSRIEKQLN